MHRRIWGIVAICSTLLALATALAPVAPSQAQTPYHQFIPITVQQLPTSLPTTGTVYVRSYEIFPSIYGASFVLGEIVNDTAAAVYAAQISARLYDAAGSLIASGSGDAQLLHIDPKQRSPFYVDIATPESDVVRTELEVTYSTVPTKPTYYPLTVLSSFVFDSEPWQVRGEVQNSIGLRMKDVRVIGTFYDAAGNVIYASKALATKSELLPDEISVYKLTITSGLSYASMSIQAEGHN